jgi:hypothetical protein
MLGTAPADLEAFLLGSRRIVILEDRERTFLRQIGPFEAIAALLRLIAATCHRTLWILSMNAVAFRFLNAAVQLGASFSHRSNAATATQADLEGAIMQRHNLSGLRLHYAAPPPEGRLVRRARRALYGRDPDPQDRFLAPSRKNPGAPGQGDCRARPRAARLSRPPERRAVG